MLLNEIVKYRTVFHKQQFPGNLKLKFHDYCLQLAKFHGSLIGRAYDILNGENTVCRQARGIDRTRKYMTVFECILSISTVFASFFVFGAY